MVIYGWDKNLETGIEIIDEQHMQMLIAVNKLLISRKCNNDAHELEDCIRFLEQYIQYHFQTEEAYLVECQYEDFRKHQAHHNYLATQLRFLTVKLEASAFEESIVEEFYTFLGEWISQHILQDDVEFAKAYRAFRKEQEKEALDETQVEVDGKQEKN